MDTPSGRIPRVASKLAIQDRLGTVKARLGIGRMNYKVDPGLYALGNPDASAPVLVSANYKMSFDRLRESLPGTNAWILALDTDGINVWCAAGKGTFGTGELVRRIADSGLSRVVDHNRVVVPQLGAPGISAHDVREKSGFKVKYGPVRAVDLPRFLDSGFQATPAMRTKTFTVIERMALVPVELVHALRILLIMLPFLLVLGGFAGKDGFLSNAVNLGLFDAAGLAIGIAAGAIITPMLLPFLPGRAFSAKGILPGLLGAVLFLFVRNGASSFPLTSPCETLAWLLLIPAVSAYLAMNFTGCSTFTSLSGVKKEMRVAVPLQIAAAAAGIILLMVARFF